MAPYIMDVHGVLPTLRRIEERLAGWHETREGARARVRVGLAMLGASVAARGVEIGPNSPDGDPEDPDEAAELVRYAEAAALAEVSPLAVTARHEREAISAATRIATRALRELVVTTDTAPSAQGA